MTTIPHIQDYDDDDPLIEQRRNRWNYWEALKQVRKEFMAQNKEFDAYDFEDYLKMMESATSGGASGSQLNASDQSLIQKYLR